MMDVKNKLQHLLQKNQWFFSNYNITYEDFNCIKKEGLTFWKRKLIVMFNDSKKEFISDLENTKIKSDYNAANKAYLYLSSIIPEKKVYDKSINDYKIIKLVDVENIGYKQFKDINDSCIIGFISKANNYPEEKINYMKSIMRLVIYENTEKEGSDVSLILYIGENMRNFIRNKNEIHIYSNDKLFIPLINIFKKHGIKSKIFH